MGYRRTLAWIGGCVPQGLVVWLAGVVLWMANVLFLVLGEEELSGLLLDLLLGSLEFLHEGEGSRGHFVGGLVMKVRSHLNDRFYYNH